MEPTKLIDLIAGLVNSSSTAVLSPCSTLNTPGGSPASAHNSAIHNDADGSFSDGLSTTVLPAAIAIGKNHIGTMAGKLNGEMMPTGPSGWRTEYTSTLVEAFSVNPPFNKCGTPQANSTTSWPRLTSPNASETTLPCSAVMILASSPLRALSNSRKLNKIALRLASEVSRHAGNAATAASITARASSTPANATSPVTSPVAGFVTGDVVPPVPG